jgi:hypothetical protein
VDGDTFLWVIGRGTGAAATVALSMALLLGVALRPGFLQWFTHNRGLRAVHDAAGIIWLPSARSMSSRCFWIRRRSSRRSTW